MARKSTNGRAVERHAAGRPSAGEIELRIENLLEIAAEVFLEKGYECASVGEIATRANASKQTIYSRFPSKAELFSAVMNRTCEQKFKRVSDMLQANRPIAGVLKDFAVEMMIATQDLQATKMLRAIIGAAEEFPEVGERFWTIGPDRAHGMIVKCLSDRMQRGELRKSDPSGAAHLFLTMCTGRYWIRGLLGIRPRVTKAEIERYTEQVVQKFLSMYRPER